jgi:DNA-binding transcriptional LysR family regulator
MRFACMGMFVKVAELLSFAAAAKQLGVPGAVVTRGVAALETHLNTRLLNRTKRRISLTEAGQAYLQGCTELFTQLDMLEASVSFQAGSVAVRCSAMM